MSARESPDELLASRARVADQVVYRTFPTETVVLNLATGKYHGLNASAGRMLEALERSDSVGEALAELTGEYDAPPAEIERDLRRLCGALLERGLIELKDPERR
jgi:hypothetical protein